MSKRFHVQYEDFGITGAWVVYSDDCEAAGELFRTEEEARAYAEEKNLQAGWKADGNYVMGVDDYGHEYVVAKVTLTEDISLIVNAAEVLDLLKMWVQADIAGRPSTPKKLKEMSLKAIGKSEGGK